MKRFSCLGIALVSSVFVLACQQGPQRMPLLHEFASHQVPIPNIEGKGPNMPDEQAKSQAQDLSEKALKLYRERKYLDARPILMDCADACTADEHDLKVKVLSLAARTYGLVGTCEEGRETLESARALLDQVGPEAKASFGIVDGIFIRESGDRAAAEAHFSDLADFCANHELWGKAVDAIHHAAIVAKPEDQEKWALKGIAAAESGGEETEGWLGPLWNNLGWTYDELGEHEKALDALEKARDAHYANGRHGGQIAADSFVAHALIQVGRLAEAKPLMVKVREAASKALEEAPEDAHWQERMLYVDWKEADILNFEGQKKEALSLYRKAYAGLVKLNAQGWYDEWLVKIEASAKSAGGSAKSE